MALEDHATDFKRPILSALLDPRVKMGGKGHFADKRQAHVNSVDGAAPANRPSDKQTLHPNSKVENHHQPPTSHGSARFVGSIDGSRRGSAR